MDLKFQWFLVMLMVIVSVLQTSAVLPEEDPTYPPPQSTVACPNCNANEWPAG